MGTVCVQVLFSNYMASIHGCSFSVTSSSTHPGPLAYSFYVSSSMVLPGVALSQPLGGMDGCLWRRGGISGLMLMNAGMSSSVASPRFLIFLLILENSIQSFHNLPKTFYINPFPPYPKNFMSSCCSCSCSCCSCHCCLISHRL